MRGQSSLEYLLLVAAVVLFAVAIITVSKGNISTINDTVVNNTGHIETGACPQEARIRGEATTGCACGYNNECNSTNCTGGLCAS
ncbi:hypothetical protein AUJ14_00585 [Candidatus Micrarchaeota archaeon CG1_02_55_22]|nr:MAG: hypothetical protein AUJ14_00585 [Candidatus Micrarchaeota archaeon CG1_02_55_22]